MIENTVEPVQSKRGPITWAEYTAGAPSLFDGLHNIQEFALWCSIPPILEVQDAGFAAKLAMSLYAAVLDAIAAAHFFHEDALSIQSSPGQATVRYDDDRFDFSLSVGDGQIFLRRAGSRFEDFHSWYVALGPQFAKLFTQVVEVLRTTADREFKIQRGYYTFKFLLHALETRQTQRSARNTEIMSRLLRGIPDDSGRLSDGEDAMTSAGRIDTRISRWVRSRDAWRLERYDVEAPANKEGAGLWLEFTYLGETYTDPKTL